MIRIVMVLLLSWPLLASSGPYPTTETVKFVVGCMADNGGETEENLYTCACRYDVLTSLMAFEDYESASLYERYKRMPGKRGGLFRDSDEGREQIKKLTAVRKLAAERCPVVHIVVRPPGKKN